MHAFHILGVTFFSLKLMTADLFIKHNLQVVDETFLEEPGSGVVAIVNNKKVSVGTLEWITRYLSLILLSWFKGTQDKMYFSLLILVMIRIVLYIDFGLYTFLILGYYLLYIYLYSGIAPL